MRLGGDPFFLFSTSFFANFGPKNDPKRRPTSMKNEVEKRTRKRRSKSKKKYEKKTPRRDAKTSKTKQNAQRGDDFRKMHISAQWTNKLRKSAPKSSKNDPKMRHNALKNRPRKHIKKIIAKILKMTLQKVSKKLTLFPGWAPWGAPGASLAPQPRF